MIWKTVTGVGMVWKTGQEMYLKTGGGTDLEKTVTFGRIKLANFSDNLKFSTPTRKMGKLWYKYDEQSS